MSKYSEMTKEELVDEIKTRKITGVDLRANKETLVAALEAADKPEEKPSGPLASQIPFQPEMPSVATQPSNEAFAKGFKAKNNVDGYTYEVVKDDGDAVKPYKARVPKQASGHPGMYWEGTEAEFKDTFTKV